MTTEQQKLARERMRATPFAPEPVKPEFRDSHSLEYIAFYLGEIEGHLAQISGILKASGANGAQIALQLQGIAGSLRSKT
jgi:hypothetical protein